MAAPHGKLFAAIVIGGAAFGASSCYLSHQIGDDGGALVDAPIARDAGRDLGTDLGTDLGADLGTDAGCGAGVGDGGVVDCFGCTCRFECACAAFCCFI